MRLDKLTVKAQEALQAAQHLAESNGAPEITPEHLLLTLLEQEGGIVVPILQKLGADPRALRTQIEQDLARLPKVGGTSGGPAMSPRLRNAVPQAWEEAQPLKEA